MKILSLTFKNINSLKGEHHIDLTEERFSQNPLFAITGPTGSGKTTILDVISLALFNKVPRLGKISNRDIEQGALMTRNQESAFAEVCYECKKGRFISVWSISTNRNGNLREYEMELSQLTPLPLALDLKKSEVPDKNEELIGLSYSQFSKSVLLAQGEFAKFLKANKKERSQLLEQITGTGIYRELGIKAYRKYKDKNKIIEQEIHLLESQKNDLLSEDDLKELKENVEQLSNKINSDKNQLEGVKHQLTLRTDLQELLKNIKTKKEEFVLIEQQNSNFWETKGELLLKHENVQDYAGDLQAWNIQNSQLKERKKEKQELVNLQEQQEDVHREKLAEIREFIGKEVAENKIESALQGFYQKIDKLIRAREKLQSAYKEKAGLFNREMEVLEVKEKAQNFVAEYAKWQNIITDFETKKEELYKNFEVKIPLDFQSDIEETEQYLEDLRNAQNDKKEIVRLEKEAKKIQKQRRQIENELAPLPDRIKNLSLQTENCDLKLKYARSKQEKQLMRAELTDLRKKLEKGEACPLCGSKTHPFAEYMPEEKSDLDKEIAELQKSLDSFKDNCSKLETQKKSLEERQKEIEGESVNNKLELTTQRDDFLKNYKGKFDLEEINWKELLRTQKNRLNQLKRLRELDQKGNSLNRAKPIFKEIQEIVKKGSALKDEILSLYQGDNLQKEVRNLETSWQKINQKLTTTQAQLRKINTKSSRVHSELKKLVETLLPKLKAQGFVEIEEAKAALLPLDQYKDLKQKKEHLRDQINTLKTEIQTLVNREKTKRTKLKTNSSVETLTLGKEKLESELQHLETQKIEYHRSLKNNDELLEKVANTEKNIKTHQEKNRRWRMLSDLIGDAKGDNFNQFAQDLTLRHLLKLANKHIKNLSDRYLLTTHKETKDGLEIADLDMGGQRRSVKTLSGGESFLISLSLALALSDLASKSININSLFIDEGFGTLDPETLDQTLDTLERLQASSSKTIGIISHVESLKERIGTQIQLQPDGHGYSRLKIISI